MKWDRKTLEHAHYWLGDILEMLVPDIVHGQGSASYYQGNIYRELISYFPEVVMGSDLDYGVAWRRLHAQYCCRYQDKICYVPFVA